MPLNTSFLNEASGLSKSPYHNSKQKYEIKEKGTSKLFSNDVYVENMTLKKKVEALKKRIEYLEHVISYFL